MRNTSMISIVRIKVDFMADTLRQAIVELPTEIVMAGEGQKNQFLQQRIAETLIAINIRPNPNNPEAKVKIIKTEYI